MKLKATIEVYYEVNPSAYSFSKGDDVKKSILNFERSSFDIELVQSNVIFPPGAKVTIKVEEVE